MCIRDRHDSGARHARERRIEGEKAILQGIARVAGSRVHHEARGLIDHEELAFEAPLPADIAALLAALEA